MAKRDSGDREKPVDRDLYSGLIRLHVLHHASEEPIFGLGMIEELARHGYRISPGSLYPLLHGLEQKGYLRSTTVRNGSRCEKSTRQLRADGRHWRRRKTNPRIVSRSGGRRIANVHKWQTVLHGFIVMLAAASLSAQQPPPPQD